MTWAWDLVEWYPVDFCRVRRDHVTRNCTRQRSKGPVQQSNPPAFKSEARERRSKMHKPVCAGS